MTAGGSSSSSVIPDRTLTQTSNDGGVLWLDVPAGVYRFSARHPSDRFASFIATCEPGRLVNANPPQGLYQLRPGERDPYAHRGDPWAGGRPHKHCPPGGGPLSRS